ncbi:MAG: MotA/TolQ/ExbB proton channel family protein [Verrucomicrobia bacterium]|nr:MotA/TolQ/ExbB proton channel family protein [Verrucomicrobiota bacterium]
MEPYIMAVLVLTSVVSLTFIIERGLALRRAKVIPPTVAEAVANCRTAAELPMLRRLCEQHPAPLSRLLVVAADHLDGPRGENTEALQTRARHEVAGLERGLVALEIITGIAPLLGLVGTIYGLITLFASVGQAGLGDNSAFAKGIALALNATLMGLVIAIPSLIAWSYYSKKVENFAIEMESVCDAFLRRHYRNGGKP